MKMMELKISHFIVDLNVNKRPDEAAKPIAENIQNFLSKFPTMCLGPKVKLLKVNPHEAHLNNDLLV